MEKIKIQLSNGDIIKRKPNMQQCGNFQIIWIRYNNNKYIVGDGDEYLRGYPDVFKLGKKII